MVSKSRRMQHVRKKFETNDKYTLLLLSLAIFCGFSLFSSLSMSALSMLDTCHYQYTKLPNVRKVNLK